LAFQASRQFQGLERWVGQTTHLLMENMKKERRPLSSIALDYFEYAGRHIPQQCASDEFYFLPRAESAVKHLNVLDDLTPEKIQDHIRYVQNLLCETSEKERNDLEGISTHCPYFSAHETYPGHHILDQLRIHHSNPIRRQIESPLFYEGWACYGEQLLNELGYIYDPRQQLIHLKRLLWRSLRATMDVELQTGKVTLVQAAKKMETFGFSTQRTQRQIRRFALTPGYQLCYFMGMYEINRLRKRFSSRLGLKSFHDTLLGGGEIPFHLVERRLEASDAEWKRSKN